jgi:hypothetical protein
MSKASRSTSASSQTWAYRTKLKSALGEEFKEYEEFKEFKEMLVGTMISRIKNDTEHR